MLGKCKKPVKNVSGAKKKNKLVSSQKRPAKKVRATLGRSMPNSYILIILVLAALLFGPYMVFSASYVGVDDNPPWYYLVRHLANIAVGAAAGFAMFQLSRRKSLKWIYISMGASMALLIIAYVYGAVAGGSRRWINLGLLNLQPSEMIKVFVILLVARLLTRKKNAGIIIPLSISFTAAAMVAIQNLSSAILILLPVILMLIVYGISIRWILGIGAAGAAGFAGFVLIEPYRQSRLVNYLSVLLNPVTADYQAKQSLYALADGGLLGVGITNSKQKFFHLPEHHTDFIFAIVGEELGFFIASLLILLLFLIGYIIIRIARESEDPFTRYSVFGFGVLFIGQTFLNLAVVTALFPVTGVTLPFISYGGSSVLSFLMIIGCILGLSLPKKRRSNEKK